MSIRVLLVDDHAMVREGLRAVLERDGTCTVVGEAGGGRDAVRLAEELHPDVVVMDVAMEGLNGIEATRRILGRDPEARVVVLSSHADRRYVRAALAAGAAGYVLKTAAYDDLQRAVVAANAGRSYLAPEVTNHVIESALRSPGGVSARDLLAPRELEVLQLLAEGLTSGEMGDRLHVATSTIETHRRNIMRKLDLHSIAELTKYAIREGLTSLDASPHRSRR